jgi:hypothetical protein
MNLVVKFFVTKTICTPQIKDSDQPLRDEETPNQTRDQSPVFTISRENHRLLRNRGLSITTRVLQRWTMAKVIMMMRKRAPRWTTKKKNMARAFTTGRTPIHTQSNTRATREVILREGWNRLRTTLKTTKGPLSHLLTSRSHKGDLMMC